MSDRKIAADSNNDGIIDYFSTDVFSCNDYYVFGATMPGRNFSSNSYRYGFNGKENDPETVGTGSGTQDYGMRIYNPALGKFLSVDPLTTEYPELTPYQFASNRTIQGIDRDGEEFQLITGFIAAGIDYGSQVVANYNDPTIKNPWTDNINVTSIGGSFVEGALTGGASIVKKVIVKVTVATVNNIVEVKTSKNGKGVTASVETDVKKVVKNTAIDLVADKVVGKTAEAGGKVMEKALKADGVNGGTIAKTTKKILNAVNVDVNRNMNNAIEKASKKVVSYTTEKTAEVELKAKTSKPKDELKEEVNKNEKKDTKIEGTFWTPSNSGTYNPK